MKLIELFSKYTQTPEWKQLANRSREIYFREFTYLQKFHDTEIQQISKRELLDFRDELWDSPSKCTGSLRILGILFNWAIERELVDENPCKGIKKPASTPISRWEEWELDKAIETAKPRLKLALLLGLYTGQRSCDVCNMRWEDYDGQKIKLRQRKTGKKLTIPVHPRLKAELDARRPAEENQNPFILQSASNGRLLPNSLREMLSRHLKGLGIRRSFHGLRKSTGSILAELGCSVFAIMAILGHTNLKTAMKYTEERDQERLAMEAMNKWELKDVETR
jgi:integrase